MNINIANIQQQNHFIESLKEIHFPLLNFYEYNL